MTPPTLIAPTACACNRSAPQTPPCCLQPTLPSFPPFRNTVRPATLAPAAPAPARAVCQLSRPHPGPTPYCHNWQGRLLVGLQFAARHAPFAPCPACLPAPLAQVSRVPLLALPPWPLAICHLAHSLQAPASPGAQVLLAPAPALAFGHKRLSYRTSWPQGAPAGAAGALGRAFGVTWGGAPMAHSRPPCVPGPAHHAKQ